MIFIRFGILVLLFLLLRSSIFAVISFSISNPRYENEIINVDVFLSGLGTQNCASSSSCYLQGALQKDSGDNYFGATKNNKGDWYSCKQSQEKDIIKSNFFSFNQTNGEWSGTLSVKAEVSEGYFGPGQYKLKAWRYTGNSKDPAGETETLTVNIIAPTLTPTNTPTPTQTPTDAPTNTSTCTPKPANISTMTLTKTPTGKPLNTLTITPTREQNSSNSALEETEEPEVLGTETASGEASLLRLGEASPSSQVSFRTFVITFAFLGAGCALLSLAFVLRKQFFET